MSSFRINCVFVLIFIFLQISLAAQSLPDNYQFGSALEKQELLWELIESNIYNKLPVKGPSAFDMLKLFQVDYLTATISHQSDEMPLKRKRLIHTYGCLAKIIFTPAPDTPYTGLFNSVVLGIIRASVVKYDPNNLMPGIALKFFIDGRPSLNTLALYSIDGQGKNYNYFAYPFSNIIPPPTSATMRAVLNVFTKAAQVFDPNASATKVSVNEFAKVGVDGSAVSNPVAPEQIFFYPASEVVQDSNDNRDFRIKLNEIPVGTKLFEVFVKYPADLEKLLLIGEITLQSQFIASKYGDEKIFFQHPVK